MNVRLKAAILAAGLKQYELAHLVGTETRLSRIIQGRLTATPDEQLKLAKVLRRPVQELFDTEESTPALSRAQPASHGSKRATRRRPT